MSRAIWAGLTMVAVVACKGDNQPTSPVTPTAASDGLWVGGARAEVEFSLEGKPRQSNDVEALAVISHVRGQVRFCNGDDGGYAENHQIATGTVTGDPRLTGSFELRITEIVHFGGGVFWTPSFGTFVIRDPSSGRTKAEGDYNAWASNDAFEGTFVGRGLNGAGQAGGNLIANVSNVQPEDGSYTIHIGGPSPKETRMSAGIFDGKCSGKFTGYEGDVPAPSASATTQIRTSRSVSPLWRSLGR